MGRWKCSPNAGWMGDAIVNPSRFRKEASSTAGTDKSKFFVIDDMDFESDDVTGSLHACSDACLSFVMINRSEDLETTLLMGAQPVG